MSLIQVYEYFINVKLYDDCDLRYFLTRYRNFHFIQPLDRDPPTGYEQWQLIIKANDEGGPSKSSTSLFSTTEVLIRLIDKNDNAPFLKMVFFIFVFNFYLK